MENQKTDNLLNLAVDATPQEREKSLELDVGYEPEGRLWDVIVKYSGDISALETDGITVAPLLNEYAVVTVPQDRLDAFISQPYIEYVEKPKRLFFAVNQARAASCITQVQISPWNLNGQGVLVGIVDSGIDYHHPDFINEDGTTRIVKLWDQSVSGNSPQGYALGAEFDAQQINQALEAPTRQEAYQIVPSRDGSGHGTAVAGIAAGNGRASEGVYRGVAPESQLLVVKLGNPKKDSFPRTTELIQGVDYVIRQSIAMGMPLALNLSFGNNYGSHLGDTLLETYLTSVANLGRNCICVGMGNNGVDGLHTSGRLEVGRTDRIEVSVGDYEPSLNIQLWKNYADQVDIYLTHPSSGTVGPLYEELGPQRYQLGQTQLLIYYGKPSPYSASQEIYFDFIPQDSYVDRGIWTITLDPRKVVDGQYNLWLPGGGVLNTGTRFYFQTPDATLTIPAAASRVISVGAYNSRTQSYAEFSGRGFLQMASGAKPDLVAPGVNIRTAQVGRDYTTVTGTSFATPFVAGAAALMMEWGIVRGNDPYLYGEKVKAYLRRGARPLPGFEVYPNAQVGYGALCLRDSLPV
ncbi:MAG: S8 family peptidase [Lachnospiraceae bacterium]|nr:S8 family peptidase [Lachnospiraceae bacterium]